MVEGVDYSFARPGGANLKAHGKLFAGRYLWYNTSSKGINQSEWNDLVNNGVAVFQIYEEDGREMLGGFAAGVACAKKAESYRINNGLPAQPIYFCVDFDASAAQQAAINAFLQGAATVIGDRAGIYAGYYVVKRALDAGVTKWAFQTYAWSGGNVEARAAVYQYLNGQSINGSVDFCRNLQSNFGGSSALAAGGGGSSAPASGGNITSRPTNQVQQALANRGIGLGPSGVDGVYGPATTAAVAEFQKQQGLTIDGVYGPVTDAHLFGVGLVVDGIYGTATCKAEQGALGVPADGQRGPQTISAEQRLTGAGVDGVDGPDTNRHLQSWLNAHGYNCGAVDGVRGRNTIAAMQRCLNDGKFHN
jgi:peptidoglycan hydrolase-like protein with peptidoglycan-binding domain